MHLSGLSLNDVSVELSGGSEANLTADGAISANLSGGSELTWDGSGSTRDVNLSGGSRVRKR